MNIKLKSGVTIMDHMVTTDEWNKVMPNDRRAPGMTLTMVSASMADRYAAAVAGRLPSEEEWEEMCGQERPYGAFWEWTSTTFEGNRVLRGGLWGDARRARRASRNWLHPVSRYRDTGFRVCWDNKETS